MIQKGKAKLTIPHPFCVVDSLKGDIVKSGAIITSDFQRCQP
jgi:hypothetical protein